MLRRENLLMRIASGRKVTCGSRDNSIAVWGTGPDNHYTTLQNAYCCSIRFRSWNPPADIPTVLPHCRGVCNVHCRTCESAGAHAVAAQCGSIPGRVGFPGHAVHCAYAGRLPLQAFRLTDACHAESCLVLQWRIARADLTYLFPRDDSLHPDIRWHRAMDVPHFLHPGSACSLIISSTHFPISSRRIKLLWQGWRTSQSASPSR